MKTHKYFINEEASQGSAHNKCITYNESTIATYVDNTNVLTYSQKRNMLNCINGEKITQTDYMKYFRLHLERRLI